MGYWIVVVDDDTIELKNIKVLLSGEDLKVSCLRSGADLLKFMENNTPDLVILDILMPEMDGFETFHALRELEERKNKGTTPVFFLSGNNDSATERRGLKDGASDFIRKPFDKGVLLSRIVNTIENNKTIISLTEKATLDKLTGFMNKSSGTDKITALCREKNGALMLLDLDNFKPVNDIYGHDMGDQVLIAFSEIVRHNTRTEDVISRIGGDEFLAFFENLSSKVAVKALTDRLNEQLLRKCAELMGDEFDIPIGISIGVAFVPQHSRDFSVLFRCVDSTMYRVKQNGKHGVEIADEDMTNRISANKSDLETEMDRITQILKERGASEGVMVMGKDTFIQTYRFALRFLRRYKKGAEKILFCIFSEHTQENISEIAAVFMDILLKNLRKSDVVVQVRSDQFLVFLPVITQEEARELADRIKDAFDEVYKGSVKLQYVAEHISFE